MLFSGMVVYVLYSCDQVVMRVIVVFEESTFILFEITWIDTACEILMLVQDK